MYVYKNGRNYNNYMYDYVILSIKAIKIQNNKTNIYYFFLKINPSKY